MCQKWTFSGDTFYYPSSIFNVCNFEIFVTPTGKTKKLCRKQVTELLSEKHLLTLSLMEAVGGEEASGENAENTGLGVRALGFRNQVGHLRVT